MYLHMIMILFNLDCQINFKNFIPYSFLYCPNHQYLNIEDFKLAIFIFVFIIFFSKTKQKQIDEQVDI